MVYVLIVLNEQWLKGRQWAVSHFDDKDKKLFSYHRWFFSLNYLKMLDATPLGLLGKSLEDLKMCFSINPLWVVHRDLYRQYL